MFKPGDKVKCIEMASNYADKLTIGEIYTVSSKGLNNWWLRVLENDEINSYETQYFELVINENPCLDVNIEHKKSFVGSKTKNKLSWGF